MAARITSLERGNFRRDIFLDDQDRQTYLDQLAEEAGDAVANLGSLPDVESYSPDRRARTSGLHGQSFPHRAQQLLPLAGNPSAPLRPRLAEQILLLSSPGWWNPSYDYAWSSARAHAGFEAVPEWHGSHDWVARYPPEKWREVLGLGFHLSGDLERLRQATRTGRPFGAPDFVAELEAKLDRALLPQKGGPKLGAAKQSQPPASGSPDV